MFFSKVDPKKATEKIEHALAQLDAVFEEQGIQYPDYKVRAKAVKYLCSVKDEYFTKKHYRQIFTYLQRSPAYLSAEFLEDEFGFDFEAMGVDFEVDYRGGYTFVDDKWLPKALVKERRNFERLRNFYVLEATENPKVRKKISKVSLPGMYFDDSGLYDMRFEEAALYGFIYTQSEMDGVSFYDCNLQNAHFEKCDFHGVRFIDCRLDNAKFIDCTFEHSNLKSSQFRGAEFTRCSFSEVDLFQWDIGDADLSSCDFDRCFISFSDLRKQKGLAQESLNKCLGDDEVLLPEYLLRPDFWPGKAGYATWTEWLNSGDIQEGTGTINYE